MHFEQTWRWFGPYDTTTLEEIKQTGATGIVSALHEIPIGTVWPVDKINAHKKKIEDAGFRWSVVESVPIHEDVKRQRGDFQKWIENYKQSIRHLSKCGIDTICYNFMPVLDWTRTDLQHRLGDGSTGLRFDEIALAAFDIFILKRKSAEDEYNDQILQKAKEYAENLNDQETEKLTETILAGLPGSEEGYSYEEFREMLSTYDGISAKDLQSSLIYFLKEIIPVAEEVGVRMAIHPDDPPFPLFGLPRVVSTEEYAKTIIEAVDSPYNGLTFCTGSYGARADNDLPKMVESLGHRINFVHLRSVKRELGRSFHEANHLEGDGNLVEVMKALILEQHRRKEEGRTDLNMPFRPDHGHQMLDDLKKETFPGYSCIGRMRGLAELRGIEMGIRAGIDLR